jgi:hypothetical protein
LSSFNHKFMYTVHTTCDNVRYMGKYQDFTHLSQY